MQSMQNPNSDLQTYPNNENMEPGAKAGPYVSSQPVITAQRIRRGSTSSACSETPNIGHDEWLIADNTHIQGGSKVLR
jgi:hypothetical protein